MGSLVNYFITLMDKLRVFSGWTSFYTGSKTEACVRSQSWILSLSDFVLKK